VTLPYISIPRMIVSAVGCGMRVVGRDDNPTSLGGIIAVVSVDCCPAVIWEDGIPMSSVLVISVSADCWVMVVSSDNTGSTGDDCTVSVSASARPQRIKPAINIDRIRKLYLSYM
jgi:hypothetical protein